jgi:hypothetical protein
MRIRWGGWGSPRAWIAIFGVLLISFALSSNRLPSALNGALIMLGVLLLLGLVGYAILERARLR